MQSVHRGYILSGQAKNAAEKSVVRVAAGYCPIRGSYLRQQQS